MKLRQQFRKALLQQRRLQNQWIGDILAMLQTLDPHAALVPVSGALASKALIQQLWQALPEEHHAYTFPSIEQLSVEAAWCVQPYYQQRVTFHCGWDVVAYTTTAHAAWAAWPLFATRSPAAYNCCIYPESLAWYIIRAGPRLYPIDCSGVEAVMMRPPNSGSDGY